MSTEIFIVLHEMGAIGAFATRDAARASMAPFNAAYVVLKFPLGAEAKEVFVVPYREAGVAAVCASEKEAAEITRAFQASMLVAADFAAGDWPLTVGALQPLAERRLKDAAAASAAAAGPAEVADALKSATKKLDSALSALTARGDSAAAGSAASVDDGVINVFATCVSGGVAC